MSVVLLFAGVQGAAAQDDPIGRLLKDGLKANPEDFRRPPVAGSAPGNSDGEAKTGPVCPDGWECTFAGRVVKGNYKQASEQIDIGALTGGRGYDRISLRQTIGETHGVIVNTIKIGRPGSWKTYSQGIRLPEGPTIFNIPVPAGTPAILLSLDHGQGARLRVVLERRLP